MDPDLEAFLREDLGAGDITTRALDDGRRVRARIVAKEDAIVCGMAEASAVFAHLGAKAEHLAQDGARVQAGAEVMRVAGPAAAVLTGERLALNLLMRMSGIATMTRALQDQVAAANPRCRVAATRKTTPGFRRFEKRAVEAGGGDPHRFGLHDAFLVKDNHLLLVPDVAEAVRRCRALDPAKLLQVEADRPEQAFAAAEAGADAVLLDNFGPDEARRLYGELKARFPRLMVEVSGGIHAGNVAAYAHAADRISMGALTHSARAIDFGLDVLGEDEDGAGRTP
ncbi:MAG TPA: carboxylating nicotinate-nucleotide diphosphorylase [Candidatus Thermoplasmatota archaeon]|nr:carboxylating nicotinate-nucleotide diphosphorylase [Candidatus Thermoplasmatota archaeon]